MSPPIIMIAAMSPTRVIGQGDGMPWHLPEEYAQFLRQVRQQTIVMGRRSFEIFGPDLKQSHVIVVSRSPSTDDSVDFADSLQDALQLARTYPKTIFIGGGASIYRQALPYADRLHLSVIHGDFAGDAFFPTFSTHDWHLETSEQREAYDYFEYGRRVHTETGTRPPDK